MIFRNGVANECTRYREPRYLLVISTQEQQGRVLGEASTANSRPPWQDSWRPKLVKRADTALPGCAAARIVLG